jgi:hypothetical protein
VRFTHGLRWRERLARAVTARAGLISDDQETMRVLMLVGSAAMAREISGATS